MATIVMTNEKLKAWVDKIKKNQALLSELEKPFSNLTYSGVARYQQEQIIFLLKELYKMQGGTCETN